MTTLPTDIEVGDPFHAEIHNTTNAGVNELRDAVASALLPIPYLAGVPVFVYGDSYTRYAPPEGTPAHRIARRHQMLEPVNRGVSGTRCSQIYQQIEDTWAPNTRGLVVIGSATINNVREYPGDESGYETGAEAFRACLAYLSTRAVTAASDSGTPTRFGPGWVYDPVIDGWQGNSAANRYVDIAWTGNVPLDLFCWFTDDAGGTLEVHDEAGNLIAYAETGGYSEDFTGVVTVPAQGAGTHTVRARVTAGTVTIRRAGVRAATPPLIAWDKPGPILLGIVPTAELRAANVFMQDVADDFPNVVTSDNDVAGWVPDTMIVDDLAHRNDRGQAFATLTMDTALRGAVTGYSQGLNAVDQHYADPEDYVVPAAAYHAADATAPVAPVLASTAANQVRHTWNRPQDNGATLTGYTIEVRTTAGPGAWGLHALVGASSVSLLSEVGLVAGTSYDFRIKATNAVGDSAWSNVTTAVAGASPAYYSRDEFDRAGNPLGLGNADIGGAWTAYNSVFALESNRSKLTAKTNASLWAHVTVTDAQKDGYVRATVLDHAGSAAGVIMCSNSATAPTLGVAVVSYIPSNQYALMFQTAATTWIVRALYNIVPLIGDVVGIYKSGNQYTAVINGVPQVTESAGLADLTSTRHGLIAFAAGAEFDAYAHSNVNPLL